jgi:3-oxoacyl-[acyl-carrier-protein] synthase II
MGVATALECLKKSGISMPDAIITGTAYGCLEDTEHFLTKMVENGEELLTPTSFIQSTHNTVGAQIALLLKCHHYNNTFVHRGFSFENAMLDAMMLLREKEAAHVLVGSIDENTDISHRILRRFGLYKKEPKRSINPAQFASNGASAGEGSAFFLITSESLSNNEAELLGMHSFYKPKDDGEIHRNIEVFLKQQGLSINDVDLLVTGDNNDPNDDKAYQSLSETLFKHKAQVKFKQFCGEYPTATSFALWFAAKSIRGGTIPNWAECHNLSPGNKISRVLIYNHQYGLYHSLYLLSAC